MRTFGCVRHVSVLLSGVLCSAIALVPGCDDDDDRSGRGAPAAPKVVMGEVVVSLSATGGDFVTYAADLVSLHLTGAGGTTVEAVPLALRVDFANFSESTEVLRTAAIPAGTYIGATMRLDYANADVRVEDADGGAVRADLRDTDGDPVRVRDIAIELCDRGTLVIAPGTPACLRLDLDLAASHAVDVRASPPRVVVEPVLVAEAGLARPIGHRVRGRIESVHPADLSLDVHVRPFHARRGDFGTLRVAVTDATVYEIDGEAAQGAAGLVALDDLPHETPVIAIGELAPDTFEFTATEVYAGLSVPWAAHDVVHGHVAGRDGDTVYVRGATIEFGDGRIVFDDAAAVHVGRRTAVRMQGFPDAALDSDAISVGQRVTVFGTVTGRRPLTVDATEGLVRMLVTTVRGTVAARAPGLLEIDLESIGGRSPQLFDFTGTGVPAADPARYALAAGDLDLASFDPETPVQAHGFVQAFGDAPPDFAALAIADLVEVGSSLLVDWPGGAANVIQVASAEHIVLDVSGAGLFHHVFLGGAATDLTQLARDAVIVPHGEEGLYAIYEGGSARVFVDFSDFAAALATRLAAQGALVRSVSGTGRFDASSAEFAAAFCTVCVR